MRLTACLSFLLLTALSWAQPAQKWTLEACITYALSKNVSIQQAELQNQQLSNVYQQSKFNRLPAINGSVNHNYNIGRSIDPFTNTFNTNTFQSNAISLNAGMTIFSFNRVTNTIKMNKAGVAASLLGLSALKNQISLNVATAFLQIILAEENLKVVQSQLELTRNQVGVAEKKVKAGSENQGVLLNIKAQESMDRSQLITAQNQIQLAYNNLLNLLQIDTETPFEIILPDLPDVSSLMVTEDIYDIYSAAILSLPEVEQAKYLVQQAQWGQRVARSALYPSLTAYGNLSTVYSESGLESVVDGYETRVIGYLPSTNETVLTQWPVTSFQQKPFNRQIKDNFGQSFGLSLAIPIFSNLRNSTSYQNAKLDVAISSLNQRAVDNQLRAGVTTAYTNWKAARSAYDAALTNAEAQQTNFEFNQKRFNSGILNSTDLLNAKNQWFSAQQNLLSSKYDLIFRYMIIEYYKGNPLSLKK